MIDERKEIGLEETTHNINIKTYKGAARNCMKQKGEKYTVGKTNR